MKYLCIIAFGLFTLESMAQNYDVLSKKIKELNALSNSQSSVVEDWWLSLRKNHQIPLIAEDSVYFFYKGIANSVEWMGDFNGWGFLKDFPNKGKRIGDTDIWILKASFPKNARLDYKILIDGSNWILDPENKYQQWSGVGGGSPNSELRMPDWKEDPILKSRNDSSKGTLLSDLLINSKILGYQITYSVYLPFGYTLAEKYPSLYVTDGYEYLHPRLGNMNTVLDNLIEDKKIKPLIAIFIDHRVPIDRSNNRRMQELTMNSRYLDFFVNELIPYINTSYPVFDNPQQRAIMGNSVGGLTATYFAFSQPNIFGLAGIQSPAFYTRPQIYAMCSNPADPKMKISMTSGVINDANIESRKMKDILEANTCVYHYREVNEGASWGNWRGLIDDILIDLFGTDN